MAPIPVRSGNPMRHGEGQTETTISRNPRCTEYSTSLPACPPHLHTQHAFGKRCRRRGVHFKMKSPHASTYVRSGHHDWQEVATGRIHPSDGGRRMNLNEALGSRYGTESLRRNVDSLLCRMRIMVYICTYVCTNEYVTCINTHIVYIPT